MIFTAAGEAVPAAYEASFFTGSGLGTATFVATLAEASATTTLTSSAATDPAEGVEVAGRAAEVSIKQTTCPTFTTSPSAAFKEIIPLSSAGSSSVALSESTSAIA